MPDYSEHLKERLLEVYDFPRALDVRLDLIMPMFHYENWFRSLDPGRKQAFDLDLDTFIESVDNDGVPTADERSRWAASHARLVAFLAEIHDLWAINGLVRCALRISPTCAEELEPKNADIEHMISQWIVPVHTGWNLRPSCPDCNQKKGSDERDDREASTSWPDVKDNYVN